MISIEGLDKGQVLAALYNSASIAGRQNLNANAARGFVDMTAEHARKLLNRNQRARFETIHGRAVKVVLSGTEFDERWYDLGNGERGLAARVIENLRVTGSVDALPDRRDEA